MSPTKPTDAELEILRLLWKKGPSTVRAIHDELNRERPTGYTTALKLLQIMSEKGLVLRDTSQRAHVYRATHAEETMQRHLIHRLMDRAFGGSAVKLVMRALSDKKASPEELAQIRSLLDQMEEDPSDDR